MPSQEDYLDQLLRNLAENHDQDKEETEEKNTTEPLPTVDLPEFTPDIDDVSSMSEEEIMQLLSSGEELSEKREASLEEPQDVLDMVADTGDSDLQEIQELLQKSDNHEVVDETVNGEIPDIEIPDLLSETTEEESASVSEKKQKRREEAAAKKEKRAAAKEARAAAREAKAAAKRKAKEEKAAARALEKQAKAEKNAEKEAEETVESEEHEAKPVNEADLFDSSVLDSIVSEADSPDLEYDYIPQAWDEEEATESTKEDLEPTEAVDDYGSDFDLNSLFGESNAEESLGQTDTATTFPDFIALDEEDADSVLKNVSGQERKEKKGIFAKLLDLLTEEDEEEPENENIHLSEENQGILDDLDKEKKRSKKGKKKKNKKSGSEEKDGDGKPAKKEKPKKEKKPRKEKAVKKEIDIPLIPEKKLSPRKVLPIMLIGLSLGVLLIVFVNSSADYKDKKAARTAFYEGDYQTCFQNLYGKDLNESEQIMYAKSESILYIRLWLREYEMFAEEGDEMKALDSLIQTVNQYPELYAYASQWNAGSEVADGYTKILSILADKYGLSEEQAKAIADEPDDVEYTRMVSAIVSGKSFGAWKEPDTSVAQEEAELKDKLPEEAELGKEYFINNNQ